MLYPAASVAAAGLTEPAWRRLAWPSICLGFGLSGVLYAHAITAWPSLPAHIDPVARELYGWTGLAARAETARLSAGAIFVAAEPYGLAAELAHALPSEVEVIGVGSRWGPTTLPRGQMDEQQGILVHPDFYGVPNPADWRDWEQLPDIVRNNGDTMLQRYSVFRVRAVAGPFRGVVLPRP